jgi:hypothetical protein
MMEADEVQRLSHSYSPFGVTFCGDFGLAAAAAIAFATGNIWSCRDRENRLVITLFRSVAVDIADRLTLYMTQSRNGTLRDLGFVTTSALAKSEWNSSVRLHGQLVPHDLVDRLIRTRQDPASSTRVGDSHVSTALCVSLHYSRKVTKDGL